MSVGLYFHLLKFMENFSHTFVHPKRHMVYLNIVKAHMDSNFRTAETSPSLPQEKWWPHVVNEKSSPLLVCALLSEVSYETKTNKKRKRYKKYKIFFSLCY